MPRKNKDTFYPGQLYHIYNKVITERKLFVEKDEYWQFMKRYKKYFSSYFVTYAYCLIPNHFHFLIKVRDEEEIMLAMAMEDTNAARKCIQGEADINFFLENQFSRYFSGITIKYNNKYNRVGPLFKQGVKRVALNAYRTFEQQMHYIHLNAVHHKMVKNIEQWPYSSYLTYVSLNDTQLPREEVFDRFGGRENFIAFHQKPYGSDVIFD